MSAYKVNSFLATLGYQNTTRGFLLTVTVIINLIISKYNNLIQGATSAEIRKKYRELSKENHPDKGGDPVVFMKIAKAYQA